MLGEIELTLGDLPVQVSVVRAAERELPAQHGEEEDARGPDISWRPIVLFLAHNFRAHVARCPTEDLELDVARRTAAEAKIY